MKIKFNNYYGEMELETKIRSIFDNNIAGQIAIDGNYYIIHVDHKTHKMYSLTRESYTKARQLGHKLEEGQESVFNGEKVRGMTFDEEMLWNEDRLMACVDLWGNIAVDEEFDMDYYMQHCI